MAEWLYEEGIGEARAALIERGRLVEALIERESDAARAGSVMQGRLIQTIIPRKRGIVRLMSGEEVLLEPIPPKLAEGGNVLVEILREAIAEEGRPKRARGRVATQGTNAQLGPSLLQRIRATGVPVTPCPAHEEDRLESYGWSELMEEAISGEVGTEAAALRLYLTPAMLLIDVDGTLPPAQLGPKGAKLAAQAVRRMGLSGSIGIDLPTMNNKDERMIAAAQIDKYLPLPFERTAVNGFGFLQIIRRRERPNLMEMLRENPVATAALALLRRAERHGNGGTATITAAPAVIDYLRKNPGWIEQLGQRRGGKIELQGEASLSLAGGHVA